MDQAQGAVAAAQLIAARLDRRAQVRLLPPQLLDVAHPIGAGLLMVFSLALSTVGFWAYGPLILKLLFDTKPLVTGYILAGEAIAWSVATMAASRVTPADDQWVIRGGAVCIAIGAAGFAVAVPEGVEDERARLRLLEEFGIEIATSFGPLRGRIWRIGLMGPNASLPVVLAVLSGLEHILWEDGVRVARGVGAETACGAYHLPARA